MNPFKYGQVVSNEDFCPRPELIKQLIRFAKSGQNVVLQGERRMGKTSLIHEAFRHTNTFQLVYVDLLEIKTTDDLCRRMIKAIIAVENHAGKLEKLIKSLSRLRPTISLDPFTGQPTITLDPRISLQPDSIESVLDLVSDMRKQGPVIVVFDEFQDILNLPDSSQVLALLRSKIQFQGEIAYIYSGSVRNAMSDIFSNSDSPFFKSALDKALISEAGNTTPQFKQLAMHHAGTKNVEEMTPEGTASLLEALNRYPDKKWMADVGKWKPQ